MTNQITTVQDLFNEELRILSQKRRGLYSDVTVLCIYWQDDKTGCFAEAKRVEDLFSNSFGYQVKLFGIPIEDPHKALNDEISRLIDDHDKVDSLLIIHYGGHANQDDGKYGRFESVWTAQREGGPELHWNSIQTLLKVCKPDVLVILDCCFAAQAARGHKFTLLAACARSLETPQAGENSFTNRFIAETLRLLDERGVVYVSELQGRLANKKAKLVQTPVLIDLSNEEGNNLIVLRPLLPTVNTSHRVKETKPRGLCTIQLSTEQRIEKDLLVNITQWLATAPQVISDIRCFSIDNSIDNKYTSPRPDLDRQHPPSSDLTPIPNNPQISVNETTLMQSFIKPHQLLPTIFKKLGVESELLCIITIVCVSCILCSMVVFNAWD